MTKESDKQAGFVDEVKDLWDNNQSFRRGVIGAGAGALGGGLITASGPRRSTETRAERRKRILRNALLSGGAAGGVGALSPVIPDLVEDTFSGADEIVSPEESESNLLRNTAGILGGGGAGWGGGFALTRPGRGSTKAIVRSLKASGKWNPKARNYLDNFLEDAKPGSTLDKVLRDLQNLDPKKTDIAVKEVMERYPMRTRGISLRHHGPIKGRSNVSKALRMIARLGLPATGLATAGGIGAGLMDD